MIDRIRSGLDRLLVGLSRADEARVVAAIDEAERGNRGEVRVHLEARCPLDEPLDRAREVFAALGMHKTQEQTGVLIYIAQLDRQCAVYAGEGIVSRGEAGFWKGVVDAVARGCREGRAGEGIEAALGQLGELLREEVPGEDLAGDELPDTISYG